MPGSELQRELEARAERSKGVALRGKEKPKIEDENEDEDVTISERERGSINPRRRNLRSIARPSLLVLVPKS
jgi:hypothetical protein